MVSSDKKTCNFFSGGGGGGGGMGGGCSGPPPPCTAPQTAQCIGGSWSCSASSGCVTAPPPCAAPLTAVCQGSNWACMNMGAPPVCTGDPGDCNGRAVCSGSGPFTCQAYPSCLIGQYIETSIPSPSSVCSSATTSCPAGQYLTVTGTSSPLTFSCTPCPAGFVCAGGVGAVALSATEYSYSGNAVCTAPSTPVLSEITPGVFPIVPLKYKCGMRLPTSFGSLSPVISCPANTYRNSLMCLPCPTGAAQCQGDFHSYNLGSANVAAPSASNTPSSTPTPSTTASAAPPPEQDLLFPYLLTSPDVCASEGVAEKVLDPTTGIAVNLRYSMASSLGYNGSDAFVTGLVVCDGTYIPVDKSTAINTVNADQPFNGTTSTSASIQRRRRRLYDMLNQLSLPIDGQTVVIELGVAVPAIIAPALTNLMVALLTNASAADIQALAANVSAIMTSPEYLAMYPTTASGPGPVASGLPPEIAAMVSVASSTGYDPTFTAAVNGVPTLAITPLLDALNISSNNITFGPIPQAIRGGAVITYSNNNGGAGGGNLSPSDDSGSGSSALGALVLIPIAIGVVSFIVWYRRRKENGKAVKGKSLDNNFTDVATTNTLDLDGGAAQNSDGVKVDFAPTGTGEFANTNPMAARKSSGLVLRRTTVEVLKNGGNGESDAPVTTTVVTTESSV